MRAAGAADPARGQRGRGRWRPYAIVAGIVVSFTAFTLSAGALLHLLGLPDDLLRNAAIILLFLVAATLFSRRAAFLAARPFLFLTRRRVGSESGGFLLGIGLGLVFVPCAGPVLAAVSVLAANSALVAASAVAIALGIDRELATSTSS